MNRNILPTRLEHEWSQTQCALPSASVTHFEKKSHFFFRQASIDRRVLMYIKTKKIFYSKKRMMNHLHRDKRTTSTVMGYRGVGFFLAVDKLHQTLAVVSNSVTSTNLVDKMGVVANSSIQLDTITKDQQVCIHPCRKCIRTSEGYSTRCTLNSEGIRSCCRGCVGLWIPKRSMRTTPCTSLDVSGRVTP